MQKPQSWGLSIHPVHGHRVIVVYVRDVRNHIRTGTVAAGPSVNVDAGTNLFACWVPTFLTVGRSSGGKAQLSCFTRESKISSPEI